jgi:hypothetical protein
VKNVTDDLREHPQSAEHPDQRGLAPELQEVAVEQRLPGDLPLSLGHGDSVGDVVDRQELFGELGFRHESEATPDVRRSRLRRAAALG